MPEITNIQSDDSAKPGHITVPPNVIAEAFNNANVIVYSYSVPEKKILFVTKAVESIIGFGMETVLADNIRLLKLVLTQDRPSVKDFLRSLRKGEESSVEYRIIDETGKERHLKHAGYPVIVDNNLERIDGVIYDQTSEKNAYLALQKSEENFRNIFNTSDDLIFFLNRDSSITSVNASGALLLGYLPTEMKGKPIFSFISDSYIPEVTSSLQTLENKSILNKAIWIFKDKFDNEIPIEVNAKMNLADPHAYIICLGRDTSRYLDMEYEIQELKAKIDELNQIILIERGRKNEDTSLSEELNKLRNEFISNVSHEFRTPLVSIVGFAETIDSDDDMPDETRAEFNKIILAEAKRLANLINDILNFSKIESGDIILKKEKTQLNELLNNVVNSLMRKIEKKSLGISTDYSDGEEFVFGDNKWLKVVFENIIENSIKFTNPNGKISISLKGSDDFAEVLISDTGVGIPESEIPYLFQKFFKGSKYSNEPGTGIGLCMVKEVLDLHKGEVRISSEVNKGTSVLIKIPRVKNGR
ncbi:MAG: ATP-binding protein [Ignavibacteriaceae bacterium]